MNEINKIIARKERGFDFLIENKLYFSLHKFDDIPDYLVSQIESLENCKVLSSIWLTHTACKKIIDNARQFVYCIFTQPPFLLADTFYYRLQEKIQLKFLFGQNSDVPECNDLVDKLQLDKPKIDTCFEKQMCDSVVANLIVSEKAACLMLPDRTGRTDMLSCIFGYDESFVSWCMDLFEYKWNTGWKFARLHV